MKPVAFLAALAAFKLTNASPVVVSYDITYDSDENSLTMVACSDGEHGMMSKYGYQTIGEIPCFVAASYTVSGWNADTCGQCIRIEYNNTTIHVLAIDSKPEGLDIAEKAMDVLTSGRAAELGIVQAEMDVVGGEECGM